MTRTQTLEADSLEALRAFLHENVLREYRDWYGVGDGPWVARAVRNWFDESSNYDNRWRVIRARRPRVGRVLDVAAGCGTFLLHGLKSGFDVTGIEPEPWKHEYFRRKVSLSEYPQWYADRLAAAVGESLPFPDGSFDLVTTFQTLEHVADVNRCLHEMVRVLRPGGVLYLRCPEYRCFFEPHYRLPFLPKMNRRLAEVYLRVMGRPITGLASLNWTTERDLVRTLLDLPWPLRVERNRYFFIEKRRQELDVDLPQSLRAIGTARLLNEIHQFKRKVSGWLHFGRQERVVDLWITKQAGQSVCTAKGHDHALAA